MHGKSNISDTLHFTLYTQNFTLDTPYPTLHILHFTPHTPLYTYTSHSALHTLYTLYTPHSTFDTLHFSLHTLRFALYAPHSTLHILHPALYILHSTLHSPHSTLYAVNFPLNTTPFSHSTRCIQGCSNNLFFGSDLHDCIWVCGLHLVLYHFQV